jgi:hypothetical protein
MEEALIQAKTILDTEGCTCVLCGQGTLYKSTQRGIRPLLELLDAGQDVAGCCAADKVVGRATAFLYCLLQVKAVYGAVMSLPALEILQDHRIEARYGCTTPAIRNRSGDGFCPLETATRNLRDPQDALEAIRETLKDLR